MKTLTIITLLMVLCCSQSAFSQQQLDSTSTWKILRNGHNSLGAYKEYITISIDGDTTIQSKVYYKLYQHGIDSTNNWTGGTTTSLVPKSFYGLIREDNNKFYSYQLSGQESLLYDFTKLVGDTITHYCTDTVAFIDTVFLGTTPLRRWNFPTYSDMNSYIEGIGAVSEPIGGLCQLVGGSTRLLCYEKQGEQLIVTPGYSCSVFNTTSKVQEENSLVKVQIYPNPSSEKISIRINALNQNDFDIQLYHTNGVLLKSQYLNGQFIELNLSDYSRGIYWLKIQSPQQTLTYKLIKI
ncbi:T9SS type A sorting domain-containing protein [Aureispira sp. CCB-QB1]|uniref:T9SS type A sorting domain-containing protein n=1 Tax=Aureispira sp. CCB-QB1 TaxID=1313421 RepID=UPI0009DE8B1C|nr:T9SS type A sorting domain-containing protein [Aureispira sp. CCB-QB1]